MAISGAVHYRDGRVFHNDSESDLEALKSAVHQLLAECFRGFRDIGHDLPDTVLPMYLDDLEQAERAAFHVHYGTVHWDDQAKVARGLLGEVWRKWRPLIRETPAQPVGTERGEGGKASNAFAELLTAIDESGLSKAEAKVIRIIAEKNGSVPIVDANTLCDCDARSAFKRAKPKLRKRGWHLHERHSSLCAKPLNQGGRN